MMKSIIKLMVIAFIMMNLASAVSAENDVKLAIDTIIYESRSEPLAGQILVAKCIQNRMRERHQTIEQVIYAPYQFSCYKNKKPIQSIKQISKEFMQAKIKAKQAWEMAKELDSKVNLYCTSKIADKTYWTKSPKVEFLGKIGSHNFYSEVR